MATQTSYLQLTKPALTDQFDLNVMNANWDKIDTGVAKLGNFTDNKQMTNLNDTSLGNGIYYAAKTLEGLPHSDNTFDICNLKYGNYSVQIALQRDSKMPSMFLRSYNNSEAEPSLLWCRVVTNQNFPQIRAASGYNDRLVLTVPKLYRGVIFMNHTTAAQSGTGAYLITSSTSGVFCTEMLHSDGITYTTSGLTITFQTTAVTFVYPSSLNLASVITAYETIAYGS